MPQEHFFRSHLHWTGAIQGPTVNYGGYSREYQIEIEGKPTLAGSAAGPFRGDESLHNPEDMLLAAVAACHCLSYLALCARRGVVVVAYQDQTEARMAIQDGKMRIVEATLHPEVWVASGTDLDLATKLHGTANEECFIANSVRFPIHHFPIIHVRPEN